MNLFVKGTSGPLTGEVLVPNSKYHAHRALILASLAPGTSRILGLSDARHVQYTMDVLRALGTKIEVDQDTLLVTGGRYHVKRKVVSVGSSGSTLYFMIGLAALADAPITLTAQKYFRRRPVGPLLEALAAMGVRFESADGCPPIAVQPGDRAAARSSSRGCSRSGSPACCCSRRLRRSRPSSKSKASSTSARTSRSPSR